MKIAYSKVYVPHRSVVLDKPFETCCNNFMRKLSAVATSSIIYLSLALPAFAQNSIDAPIIPPAGRAISPETNVGTIIGFLVAFIIAIAFVVALFYIVIGALQWITSGGDKQKVADARNHIIAAIIGLIIIALSFVIVNVLLDALGLGTLDKFSLPQL